MPEDVFDAISGAMQLDHAERSHLFDLTRAANVTTCARRKPQQTLPQADSPSWIADHVLNGFTRLEVDLNVT